MDADFYIGLGDTAVWLGSVRGMGDPATIQGFGLFNDNLDHSRDDYGEADYRALVAEIIDAAADLYADGDHDVDSWSADSEEWPWDHDTSVGTSYAYAWNNGCIHVFEEGYLMAQHYPNGARRPSSFPSMVRQHPANPVAGDA